MADYWFGPKRFGFGVRPVNWKGWLVMAVFAALLILLGLLLMPQGLTTEFTIATVLLVAVLGVIMYIKFDKQAGQQ